MQSSDLALPVVTPAFSTSCDPLAMATATATATANVTIFVMQVILCHVFACCRTRIATATATATATAHVIDSMHIILCHVFANLIDYWWKKEEGLCLRYARAVQFELSVAKQDALSHNTLYFQTSKCWRMQNTEGLSANTCTCAAFKWSGCIIQWCAVQTYLIMNPCFLQRPKHWWTQSKHAAT